MPTATKSTHNMLHMLRLLLEQILPPKALRWLVFHYGCFAKVKISYSAMGEDLICIQYFNFLKHNGYYLDIGCFHPKWASNTYLFHKAGWRGTAVDIDGHKLNYFQRVRGQNVSTIKAAVVGSVMYPKIIEVYKFRVKTGWSDIDTADRSTAIRYREQGMGDFICEKINSMNINELLNELPHINFLNIDVEGMDLDIIKNLNFCKFKIDLIVFEDNETKGKSVENLLINNGYKHIFTTGGSIGYGLMPD